MTDPSLDACDAARAAPRDIASSSSTLFELGREVTSVLDLDELLQKIPQLIARLTKFQAFAVYLLDDEARRAARSPTRSATRTTSRGRCG